jgi:hypothetical protein
MFAGMSFGSLQAARSEEALRRLRSSGPAPLLGRWKPPGGFYDVGHFRTEIDSMEHTHVIWRLYET